MDLNRASRNARPLSGNPGGSMRMTRNRPVELNSSRPGSANILQMANSRNNSEKSAAAAYDGRGGVQNTLTTHVWPKSRMLFAIVSKMNKEGDIDELQRGILKDLILEGDQRILNCLDQYEADGQRDKLYSVMTEIANQ